MVFASRTLCETNRPDFCTDQCRIFNLELIMNAKLSETMHYQRYLPLLILMSLARFFVPAQTMAQPAPCKVGLVLSGGGARAASHIGILKVLEQEKIPVDCIAATSFGALIGGFYSIGYSADDLESLFINQDWDSIFSDAPQRNLTRLIDRRNARYQGQIAFKGWNPELPTGLWVGQRLTEKIDSLTAKQMLQAQYDFDKLPIPFRAVATNLIDGKAYIFKQGSLTEAMRASMAVPLFFTPVEKDGMLLADGGLADNLPVDVARAMGADIIIAVDATSPLLTKDKIRTFINVIDQSISLQMDRNVQENKKLASIVLQPDLQNYTFNDYEKISGIVKQGEKEARKHLDEIKALVVGIPAHPHPKLPEIPTPVIDSVSFKGLKQIRASQLKPGVRIRPGDKVNLSEIAADVDRIYATRLFESVTYSLEPVGENRDRLVFNVKEAPTRTLGASLRYDSHFNFIAFAEFTSRQLFNSPSSVTISTQFGGLEDHFASLRLTPPFAQFLFVEPKVEMHELERQDIRNQILVDKFTDRRIGGQLTIGTSIRQTEMSGGYRSERVTVSGGLDPNRLTGASVQAGLTFRLSRDSLDLPEFPRTGGLLRAQADKRSSALGGDLDYSKYQIDYQRYFSVSGQSTFQVSTTAGYSRGPVPFYDRFYVGGYSFSERASRRFLGLDYDEMRVNQMAILGAGYRHQIFSRPLSFVKRGFLTGAYNGIFASTQQKSPYNFDLVNGVGIGLALDTMIGPLRATGGWGEGGRFHFDISIGPAF
jgi:NTE family protein